MCRAIGRHVVLDYVIVREYGEEHVLPVKTQTGGKSSLREIQGSLVCNAADWLLCA